MRRTALALFVVEPTHLRCGKLDLIQAKSKFRMGASVGGFTVGIAAVCVARKLEFLDNSLPGGAPKLPAAQDAARFELPLYPPSFGGFHAERALDKRPRRYPWPAGILALPFRGGVAQACAVFHRNPHRVDDLLVPLSIQRILHLAKGCCRQPRQSGGVRHPELASPARSFDLSFPDLDPEVLRGAATPVAQLQRTDLQQARASLSVQLNRSYRPRGGAERPGPVP